MTISKSKALELMQNSKGKFFSVTFVKQDKTSRKMQAKYDSNVSLNPLGFIVLKDVCDNNQLKNVNLQQLTELKINKKTYKVK